MALNAYEVLAKRKLSGLVENLLMKNEDFTVDLSNLLAKYGKDKEVQEILKDLQRLNAHNQTEENERKYVYDRFDLIDVNMGKREFTVFTGF